MDPRLLFSALATGVALWAALQYLYWRTDRPFLLLWALGSVLWVGRYVLAIVAGSAGLSAGGGVVATLAMVRAMLFFQGALWLHERPLPHWAWGVVLAVAGWMALTTSRLDPVIVTLPPYAVLSAGFAAAGTLVARHVEFPAFERRLLGSALIVYGALQVLYPMSLRAAWMGPFGFAAAAALQTVMSVSVLQMFFRQSLNESAVLARREQLALTNALSDFVTICAHCRGLRDDAREGVWVPLDDYVAVHTQADLDPTLCPRCSHG